MLPKELFKFLWKNKKDKIKRAGLYQDLDNGGIPMIDFSDIMLKNLKNSPGSRDCWRLQTIVIGVSFQNIISDEWEG